MCADQVTRIKKALPALDELRLSGNGIDHLPTSIAGFTHLRVRSPNSSCADIIAKLVFLIIEVPLAL